MAAFERGFELSRVYLLLSFIFHLFQRPRDRRCKLAYAANSVVWQHTYMDVDYIVLKFFLNIFRSARKWF